MSRPTVGWLRVAAFPDRVRRTESPDVTAVLPDPPKNGQYPAWVYVVCSFLVAIDYLIVGVCVLLLGFVLSVNGVPLPAGRPGSLATAIALAAAVHAADAAVSWWRSSPLDNVVRRALAPARGMIRHRLVILEMVSPRDVASTARPTPVTGFVDTSDDRSSPTGAEVTMWGSTGSFPSEGREESRLSFEEGDRFQTYRLSSKVGQGALSVVWQAEDVETGETIALKVFDPIVDEDTRRTLEADFVHEAKVLRSLRDHEHIITLYDSGYEPYPWIAVEYVEAGTVRDQPSVSLPVGLTIVLAVAEALEYAHGKDISHTDLKPENVLYSEDYFGRLILVTDWGKRPVVNPDLESMLSRPYAAPEQFDALPTNEPEAELIDIYQLGMLAYELFAGTQPFLTGEDTEQQVRTEVPPPPSDHTSDLPEGLDEVILTAIEKDPSDRHHTVAEFRTELLEVMLPDVTPDG
ncbi:MAG: serine/threonine-protein kinase [Halobacteriales archaeon]